jgi:hypothetical protein
MLHLQKAIIYISIAILGYYILNMPTSINIYDETLRNELLTKWAIQYLLIATVCILSIAFLIWSLKSPTRFRQRASIGIAILTVTFLICDLLGVFTLYKI